MRNGKSIRVWTFPWIPTAPSFRPQTKQPTNYSITWVSELMKPGGRGWDKKLIYSIFHKADAEAIVQLPVSIMGEKDKLIWRHSKHGNYTVTSTYWWLAHQRDSFDQQPKSSLFRSQEKTMWKRLWGLPVKGKIKHFIWRAYHQILPTGQQLKKERYGCWWDVQDVWWGSWISRTSILAL